MIENVRGFLDAVFSDYRQHLKHELNRMGYETDWRLFNASDFGVPQLRPRVVIIAIRNEWRDRFSWPEVSVNRAPTVGETLRDLMAERRWPGVDSWVEGADEIAPTIVGGSKKHGGPDLGPTRARRAWEVLGVDGRGILDAAPAPDFIGMPRLTVRMVARLQGFPDSWRFWGKKTAAYRQVGNAFPPPVAQAIGAQLQEALTSRPALRLIANG